MAVCIVCNAYFDPGSRNGAWCSRCDTNNRQWLNWRRRNPVERGGLLGLLAFVRPHIYLPLIITILSGFLGLLAAFALWLDVKPGFRAVVLLITPAGCMLSLQAIYEARMRIRQREMLRQVKQGKGKGISVQMITFLLPALAVAAVLVLTLALIRIPVLWELVKWLALIHAPEGGNSLPEKFLTVLPFVSVVGYVSFAISFTASSSLMLARRYINRLNEFLPYPVFLQGEKLARIVRREAEVELGRLDPEELRQQDPSRANISMMGYMQLEALAGPQLISLPPSVDVLTAVEGQLSPQVRLWSQAATWVWDELVRTNDGGIEMRVARQEVYKLPQPASDSRLRPHPRVRYVVRANHWGCITEIKRDVQ